MPTKTPIFLCALLTLLLAGCGIANELGLWAEPTSGPTPAGASSGASAKPDATDQPAATIVPEPTSDLGVDAADLEGVTLQFWHAWSGATEQAASSLVDEFNRDNEWGITVVPTALGDFDGVQRAMSSALDGGELPQVTTAYLYQALSWEASRPGLLVDLSRYVGDPIWGLEAETQADFYPVYWEHDVLEGRRVGLPAQGAAQVLYYNTSLAGELGYTSPPETPEQFKSQACGAAQSFLRDDDPHNDHKGGWIVSTNYSAALGWMYAFGGDVLSPDGQRYRFDTPQVQAAMTFLRSLLDEGCAWLSESQPPEGEFAGRLGLFSTGGVAGIPYQEAAFVAAGSPDRWSILPFPGENGQGVMPVYGPAFQVLDSTPEEQLASWLFVKWLTEPWAQAQLAQASGNFPVREGSLEHMGLLPQAHPQWKAALDLLPLARHEPGFASWGTVRWAVSDAATQIFRYYFEIEQTSRLAELLDQTANDLHGK